MRVDKFYRDIMLVDNFVRISNVVLIGTKVLSLADFPAALNYLHADSHFKPL